MNVSCTEKTAKRKRRSIDIDPQTFNTNLQVQKKLHNTKKTKTNNIYEFSKV